MILTVPLGTAYTDHLTRPSNAPADNGWQIISDIDDTDYLNDPSNWQIVDYNDLCAIEPALISIWDFPVGSDLGLVRDPDHGIVIVDNTTGYAVPKENFYVPEQFREEPDSSSAHQAQAGPSPERAQELAGTIMGYVTGIMPEGWEEVYAKASAVGSRFDLLIQVRFGAEDWRIMPRRDDDFAPHMLEFRDATYDPQRGAWFTATWHAVRSTKDADLTTSTTDKPPFTDPVPDEEYAADLRRYPRAAEHTPDWLRERLRGAQD